MPQFNQSSFIEITVVCVHCILIESFNYTSRVNKFYPIWYHWKMIWSKRLLLLRTTLSIRAKVEIFDAEEKSQIIQVFTSSIIVFRHSIVFFCHESRDFMQLLNGISFLIDYVAIFLPINVLHPPYNQFFVW